MCYIQNKHAKNRMDWSTEFHVYIPWQNIFSVSGYNLSSVALDAAELFQNIARPENGDLLFGMEDCGKGEPA